MRWTQSRGVGLLCPRLPHLWEGRSSTSPEDLFNLHDPEIQDENMVPRAMWADFHLVSLDFLLSSSVGCDISIEPREQKKGT